MNKPKGERVLSEVTIPEEKLEKLMTKLAKSLAISEEEAEKIVYQEYDLIASLFEAHHKVKSVHKHLLDALGQ